jgi:hypothetical protein
MTIQKIPKIPHIPIPITSHWNFLVHGTINYIFSWHAMTKMPIVKKKKFGPFFDVLSTNLKKFVHHHHMYMLTSIHHIFTLVRIEEMEIYQMDVMTTFLNGDLKRRDLYETTLRIHTRRK